ncbi:MAG: prepilin peptidase, partial [Candidatus Saccharibacteria bacterium]|nr:prepilin peptidase [Candidatus Saccharibacteria bacterium]
RSACLSCNKQLSWYDNIPIISWLALGGKCRHCHQRIGLAEFLSELGLGLSFLGLGWHFLYSNHAFTADIQANFPTISIMGWLIFIMVLLLTLSLGFLAIYDGLYGELPNFCLTISAICAIIIVILQTGNSFLVAGFFDGAPAGTAITPETIIGSAPAQTLIMSILSTVLFGGIYLVLYKVSRGKWVGDGDWLLAGIIGLALGHPFLSLVALFVANLSACLIMAPTIKGRKNHQIYFGPFLVFAFVIVYIFSDFFISVI